MFAVAAVLLFSIFFAAELIALNKYVSAENEEKRRLNEEEKSLLRKDRALIEEAERLERNAADIFFFYDLTKKLAPILEKDSLIDTFFDEIQHLGPVERRCLPSDAADKECLELALGEGETVCVKTRSERVVKYFPDFNKFLNLCLERIELYARLHQLSIYDPLVDAYNRRHFMQRYVEEFNRAEKFKLNLSFLMIDLDHFKKINDTYGHLVGDAVLKEVVHLIKESIREIDFAARFGGEEFSVILLETDKNGAIMVAERIRSRVAGERIHAFDENLTVTVSIGAASYPQNTIYSELLVEVADKALYKAKIEGRDKVCWF